MVFTVQVLGRDVEFREITVSEFDFVMQLASEKSSKTQATAELISRCSNGVLTKEEAMKIPLGLAVKIINDLFKISGLTPPEVQRVSSFRPV